MLLANEAVQAAVTRELRDLLATASPGTPLAKIQGRLLSSKVLAADVSDAVENLRNLLQPKSTFAEKEDTNNEESPVGLGNDEIENERALSHPDDEEEAGWESGSIEDSEGSEVGWVSGSVASKENPGSDTDDLEETDVSTKEREATPSEDQAVEFRPKRSLPQTKLKPQASSGQSTFLPSLSVGFVRGDSDSEWSESEAKVAEVEERKNRRGQRARRA